MRTRSKPGKVPRYFISVESTPFSDKIEAIKNFLKPGTVKVKALGILGNVKLLQTVYFRRGPNQTERRT